MRPMSISGICRARLAVYIAVGETQCAPAAHAPHAYIPPTPPRPYQRICIGASLLGISLRAGPRGMGGAVRILARTAIPMWRIPQMGRPTSANRNALQAMSVDRSRRRRDAQEAT